MFRNQSNWEICDFTCKITTQNSLILNPSRFLVKTSSEFREHFEALFARIFTIWVSAVRILRKDITLI